jgi:hypothetical protein
MKAYKNGGKPKKAQAGKKVTKKPLGDDFYRKDRSGVPTRVEGEMGRPPFGSPAKKGERVYDLEKGRMVTTKKNGGNMRKGKK